MRMQVANELAGKLELLCLRCACSVVGDQFASRVRLVDEPQQVARQVRQANGLSTLVIYSLRFPCLSAPTQDHHHLQQGQCRRAICTLLSCALCHGLLAAGKGNAVLRVRANWHSVAREWPN